MVTLHPGFRIQGVISGITMVDTTPQMLIDAFGLQQEKLLTMHQVHGKTVHVANASTTSLPEGDAVITNSRDVMIAVKVADCAGVLLWDPVNNAIGAVHSGWRGTAQNILAEAIRAMTLHYGTQPEQLNMWISPHATGERYEVGEDVHSALSAFCKPHPNHEGKWLFDNAIALTAQANEAGVRKENIRVDEACTMIDSRFHSYRRDKEKAGRGLVFIALDDAM